MQRFLTQKGSRRAGWEIPAVVISLILGAVSVSVIRDDIVAGGCDGLISVLAYIVELALVLLPLFFAVRNWKRRGEARRLAAALDRCGEEELSLVELDKVTGLRNAAPRVEFLLRRDFLTRLSFSPDRLFLLLENPGRESGTPRQPATPNDPVLVRIRSLNDAIDDAVVSAKIDRIEALTASILQTVEQRPERAEDVRRFVNYYLPTTLRLLESYSLMEKQSYQGENIRASRQGIETALDKLIAAIEQQQDRLFRAEAMDVEAEIQVLETLMGSEGKSI